MRLSAWLLLAALSAAATCAAATRPRYGGTLRVEMRAAPATLDPAGDAGPLWPLIFETLVRLDAAGVAQPGLAISWQHDAAFRRWQFTLRPGVPFQDGSPVTAAVVAAAVSAGRPGLTVTAVGDNVIIRTNHASPDLLLDLAHNGPVFARGSDGGLTGTGPFRVTSFEPGRHAVLTANANYWGGRPFIDSIDVQFGRGWRDQLADLELGKADVIELLPADVRRASEHSRTIWSSAAASLVALVFPQDAAAGSAAQHLREAMALSIDRAAMHSVLLQKQGEVTAALLPQWISGYAFVFPTAPDLARARLLANSLPAAARNVELGYDPSVRAGRALAERIAVNARDAGLNVQVSPQNARPDVRLVEIRITSLDGAEALAGIAAAGGLPTPRHPSEGDSAAELYESERKLLESFRVIPLFHLPLVYGAAPRIQVYAAQPVTRLGDWRFENLWLSGSAP